MLGLLAVASLRRQREPLGPSGDDTFHLVTSRRTGQARLSMDQQTATTPQKITISMPRSLATGTRYAYVGLGYCTVGYLRGHDDPDLHGAYNGTQHVPEACRAKCDAEEDCAYVSFGGQRICSRYRSDADSCQLQNPARPQLYTWRKLPAVFGNRDDGENGTSAIGRADQTAVDDTDDGVEACPPLRVRGFGELGHANLQGMPTHFSHIVRNCALGPKPNHPNTHCATSHSHPRPRVIVVSAGLPRFLICKHEIPKTCSPRVYVHKEYQWLYEHVVKAVMPAATLSDDIGASVACNVSLSEPEYWQVLKMYQFDVPADCRSADIVYVERGQDIHGDRKMLQKYGAERRHVSNDDDVFAAVQRVARESNLTAERVVLEELDFAQQLLKTCSTSMIVGQHGAGLLAALWSRKRRRVSLQLPMSPSQLKSTYGSTGWFAGIFGPPLPVYNQECQQQTQEDGKGELVVNVSAFAHDMRLQLGWLRAAREIDASKDSRQLRRATVLPAPFDPFDSRPARVGAWNQVLPLRDGQPARMSVRANAAAANAHAIATAGFRRREGTAFDVDTPTLTPRGGGRGDGRGGGQELSPNAADAKREGKEWRRWTPGLPHWHLPNPMPGDEARLSLASSSSRKAAAGAAEQPTKLKTRGQRHPEWREAPDPGRESGQRWRQQREAIASVDTSLYEP